MIGRRKSLLDRRTKYLQVALNGTLSDARRVIARLPLSERIIIEAGTPLIKRYGMNGIRAIRNASSLRGSRAYIVADLKMMDRGETEVRIAKGAGASAAVALGIAPTESLNAFIDACEQYNIDSMIDMMNVDYPISVLRELKRPPDVVVLHRGVDEERFNKQIMLPLHEIRRVKGAYDVIVAVAGGDTFKEVQSAIFNDADIVVVWKDFLSPNTNTTKLAEDFLKRVK